MYNFLPPFNHFGLVYAVPNEKSEIYHDFLGGPQISSTFAVISKKKKVFRPETTIFSGFSTNLRRFQELFSFRATKMRRKGNSVQHYHFYDTNNCSLLQFMIEKIYPSVGEIYPWWKTPTIKDLPLCKPLGFFQFGREVTGEYFWRGYAEGCWWERKAQNSIVQLCT